MLNTELSIPHYHLQFQHDRNRRGGGVAMYVHSSLRAIPLIPPPDLELLLVSLHLGKTKITINSYYRLPSSLNGIRLLTSSLSSMPPNTIPNLIHTGDFNARPLSLSNSSSLTNDLSSLSELFLLKQIVSSPTHFSHTGSPSIRPCLCTGSSTRCC